MPNDLLQHDSLPTSASDEPEELLEALVDLERNTSDAIIKSRSTARLRMKSKVIAQPGNSGDRAKLKMQGILGDISAGGCQILFPVPARVGDIYWLKYDKSEINVNEMFARCLRCRMIREDAYEAGFKFFEPVDLSCVITSRKADSLFD